jgi:hypothetical protein
VNIIFLDIDGVLNKKRDQNKENFIDDKLIHILKTILNKTDAKIVLSSTRRLYKDAKKIVKKRLLQKEIEILSTTPKIGDSSNRSKEIKRWLRDHLNIKKYAIIDDREDAGYDMEKNFFQTNPKIGLTYDIAEKIVDHFS